MTKPFKVNYHIAKKQKLNRITDEILNYPDKHHGYAAPKYLLFIETMLKEGWQVKVLKAGAKGISKYVFIEKGDHLYKIRFSNHKPIFAREQKEDCDFYVGISHKQVSTTDQIIAKIKTLTS
jgi:hypothetical protein